MEPHGPELYCNRAIRYQAKTAWLYRNGRRALPIVRIDNLRDIWPGYGNKTENPATHAQQQYNAYSLRGGTYLRKGMSITGKSRQPEKGT